MKNKRVVLKLLCLTICSQTVPSSLAGDEVFVMPQVLVEHARGRGCDQIRNFYKGSTLTGSPYIFDVDDPNPEPGFAYWCQRQAGSGETENPLVLNAKGVFASFASCSEQIKSINPADGLQLRKEKGLSLSSFAYIENPKKKGSKILIAGRVLVSGHDGVSETFYCHGGKWLVYVRH